MPSLCIRLITLLASILIASPTQAGTLTVRGQGDPLRLTILNAAGSAVERTEDQPFSRGRVTFQNVPAGRSLFLGVVPPAASAPSGAAAGGAETRAKISRFTFVEGDRMQAFGATLEHDEMEVWQPAPISTNATPPDRDFLSLLFNPSSPAPDRIYVGEGPSSPPLTGNDRSFNPTLTFKVNGVIHGDQVVPAPASPPGFQPCQNFFNFQCHTFAGTVPEIDRFWFNADRNANFRGVALQTTPPPGDTSGYRFFFRYGNVNQVPSSTEVPAFGPAPQCWEYTQNF
jgi:hypothetical protein